MPTKKTTPQSAATVYQFKITLMELEPAIWRRIQVLDCTLDALHECIQTAMGWTNSHLHQFEIEKKRYGNPEWLTDIDGTPDCLDSQKFTLGKLLPKSARKKTRFLYEYDFGDGWCHEVLWEGLVEAAPKTKYPRCLEGERACPPEDCGGPWGYADMLAALADKKHPDYAHFREWLGRKFDAEKFNAAETTKAMHRGMPGFAM